ncbi:MAG TPA: hypothetical protein VFH50_12980 [Acidimicrobiales bacterium]|nr:hypothetical protein [Acidimicrobiales bacterium]
MSKEQAEVTRQALEVLTSHVSDLEGESTDLGRTLFREAVVGPGDDVHDDWRRAVNLALGMGNLASKLVLELAKCKGETTLQITQRLGIWASAIEDF